VKKGAILIIILNFSTSFAEGKTKSYSWYVYNNFYYAPMPTHTLLMHSTYVHRHSVPKAWQDVHLASFSFITGHLVSPLCFVGTVHRTQHPPPPPPLQLIVFRSHPCHLLLPADDFSKSGKSMYIPIDHDFREIVKRTIITLSLIERFIHRGRSPIYRRNNLAGKPTQRRYNLDSYTDCKHDSAPNPSLNLINNL
jgi:hypothetical protein